MKKKIILMLSMIAFVVCLLAISVSAVEVDGIYYRLSGSGENATATVTNENATLCTLTNVVIPETITYENVTYTVTAIDAHAFSGAQSSWGKNQTIVSLVVPKTVTSIGPHVLRECKSITTVTIKSETVSFNDAEFYNCENLESISFDGEVKKFGQYCFYGCKNLTTVKYPSTLTEIGGHCFRLCTSLSNGDLSNTKITSIGGGAFWDCKSITEFKFPSTLTSIGSNGIQETPITTLVLPHSITTLNNDSIANNRKLYLMVLPEIAEDNTAINAGAIHDFFPKVVIYSGDKYEHLTSSGKLFASYTVKPFSEYDPSVTYTQKTFFYGATTCSKCNGLLGEESFKFTSVLEEMKISTLCTHCGGEDIKESFAPSFVDLGYSTFTANGTCSIVHGFKVDYSSIEKYNSVFSDNQVSAFGVFAVADSKVENKAFDSEGNALGGVIHYQMKQEHTYLEIKIVGIPSEGNAASGEAYTDIKFHMCAYVKIGGEIYYITDKAIGTELGSSVSYNTEK
ncbi:MAG: leucine-rich repeat domain-containing protein [Ruminococcaceae bacterium]|nr:leucine-rich repeat domain-containing protein [Oscillospiraceae bacterium]